ncbi:MAG: MBL fold metallo-hydrolase [Crocinitomicaceae bacterium]|nr:MAG: MBL fold metallo-hydrolase [Crocinitomicaceae bacterium]
MKLHIESFTFNPFQENTYVVYTDTKDAVIVDPGCYTREEKQHLIDFITDNQLTIHAILNTHCHIDHVLGNSFLMQEYRVDLYAHPLDLPTLEMVPYAAKMYGFEGYETSPLPTQLLADEQTLQFGGIVLNVLVGPGHAPGHVAFYNAENGIILSGDILFRGSFGRYDLPGGDLETLKKTLKEVMFQLPAETIVYSGHGIETTIGEEKKFNPIWNY